MSKHKQKRSRSSSSSSNYSASDNDIAKQKACRDRRSPEERYHRRKHHKNLRNLGGDSSSADEVRDGSRDQEKNGKYKDSLIITGVKIKEEPVTDDERERKYKNRHNNHSRLPEDSRRSDSRQPRENSRKRTEPSDTRGPNPRNRNFVKEEPQSDKEPEWGKKEIKTEKKDQSKNNAKPDFGLSGKLTEDANTFNGVVIKYSEPPEARKPKRRWRLYPFKGEVSLPVLHIHRQSAYLLGRDRKVADIPIDHPSCSKQHAALQYRLVPFTMKSGNKGKQIKLYVIDLESANGTYLNNQKIESKKYYELKERDVVKFGYSSREYVLLHEHSKDSEEDDNVNDGD